MSGVRPAQFHSSGSPRTAVIAVGAVAVGVDSSTAPVAVVLMRKDTLQIALESGLAGVKYPTLLLPWTGMDDIAVPCLYFVHTGCLAAAAPAYCSSPVVVDDVVAAAAALVVAVPIGVGPDHAVP